MPGRKSWGGARPGAGRKKFPPCKAITVRVPIPVYDELKKDAAKAGKLFPDYLRHILAAAVGK